MENHKIGMDTIKKHESQKKDVKSYGLSASLMTGIWCFDGSVGIVFDHKGNIALQNTKGVGIGSGTPSISGGFFKSQYWTDDLKKFMRQMVQRKPLRWECASQKRQKPVTFIVLTVI